MSDKCDKCEGPFNGFSISRNVGSLEAPKERELCYSCFFGSEKAAEVYEKMKKLDREENP